MHIQPEAVRATLQETAFDLLEKGESAVSDPSGNGGLTGPDPGGHGAPLAMVIAADLANAHSVGQWAAALIALGAVLAHDVFIRKRRR